MQWCSICYIPCVCVDLCGEKSSRNGDEVCVFVCCESESDVKFKAMEQ